MRLLLGESIDLSQHAQAISAMVRVATRLGLQRRARDITPTLAEYLKSKYGAASADNALPAEDETADVATETATDESVIVEADSGNGRVGERTRDGF